MESRNQTQLCDRSAWEKTAPRWEYDVFLAYSSHDRKKATQLAKKMRTAGLRVWFDEWCIEPGDDIFARVENGLQVSRTMVLLLSLNALSSDWVTLERNTALFRDPRNRGRRFIPVLIDDCGNKLPDTIRRICYVDLRRMTKSKCEQLIDRCRPNA